MSTCKSNSFFDQLSKLIDLPKNCISLDLHMGVDELVTCTATFHADMKSGDAQPVTKRYTLHEVGGLT